ncbi:hypothetical protein HY495_01805 [Candidatus Woesearchaeota archaeon]|nr:hypothetical protein [Candidatus Woesearchaeota archaeon]
MKKRSSYQIEERILLIVKEKPATYAGLERKLSTGYRTIKANCEVLERFGQVKIQEKIHPANGRSSHLVSITPQGFDTIKKAPKH